MFIHQYAQLGRKMECSIFSHDNETCFLLLSPFLPSIFFISLFAHFCALWHFYLILSKSIEIISFLFPFRNHHLHPLTVPHSLSIQFFSIPCCCYHHNLVYWPICPFCWCSRCSVCVFLGSPLNLWFLALLLIWFFCLWCSCLCMLLCEWVNEREPFKKEGLRCRGGTCTSLCKTSHEPKMCFEYSHTATDNMRGQILSRPGNMD